MIRFFISALLCMSYLETHAHFLFEKELLPHECGIAVVRLKKPLSYYHEKYQDIAWGLRKTCLLLEKQRNRGQDGAGIATVKLNMPSGKPYIQSIRSAAANALEDLFIQVNNDMKSLSKEMVNSDETNLKQQHSILGEIYLGHVRYGTYGAQGIHFTQPFIRKHLFSEQSFTICGNFNMTNADEIFQELLFYGINPSQHSDTKMIMEQIAYYGDSYHHMTPINHWLKVIEHAAQSWDGGYVFALASGDGNVVIWRDPAGIRPCFFYSDDEVIACASERAALMNAFNVAPELIKPLAPGSLLSIDSSGNIKESWFKKPEPLRQCAFERIYFSRGNDPAIYQQRKALGKNLAQRVLTALGDTLENTIFTYIPNTSEIAFMGLVEEINAITAERNVDIVWQKAHEHTLEKDDLRALLHTTATTEKVAHKDQLLRTFIAQDAQRFQLVANIYDVTRGIVTPQTRLVVMDDSIVRGTTLRESVIRQLAQLNPKEIIIVSSAPAIIYPDCYGIDMSQISRLIGFQATIACLKQQGKEALIDTIASQCKDQKGSPSTSLNNYVRLLYDAVPLEELEAMIATMVRTNNLEWKGKVTIIYQTIEGLHKALPHHTGDWYFTGDYPTPGGLKVLNNSFLQWYEGKGSERAY